MGEVSFVDVSKRCTWRVDGELHHVQALDHVSFSVRDDLAVAHAEADMIERLHVMQFAVHAPGAALGYVDETHLTHSKCSALMRFQWLMPTSLSAFSRYSGAVTVFISSGWASLPAFTICSWIHRIFSAGNGSVGSTAWCSTASS